MHLSAIEGTEVIDHVRVDVESVSTNYTKSYNISTSPVIQSCKTWWSTLVANC